MNPETQDKAPDFTSVQPPPKGSDDKPKEPAKPKRSTRATPPKSTAKVPSLEKQLEETFGGISMLVMATGDEYCAMHIAHQAKPLAAAWAELAKQNETIERMLRRMLEGSAWGGVIFVTAATVIPIAAHHGLYPKNFPLPFEFGIGPPPPPSDEVKKQNDQR